MSLIKFADLRISDAKRESIDRVNAIVSDYRDQGLSLTLRQVYYQFVSRGWCPNNDKEYKKLGDIVSDGRMAGLIDWSAIEDRTRYLRTASHWESPAQIVSACAAQFKIDKWLDQPNYVEVWIEKDALIGVVEAACVPLDVPHFSCRGYASQTALFDAGRRIASKLNDGKSATILHFGDHDPSGIDMTRDIRERVAMFSGGGDISVHRLALNMNQVKKYNPPPNPAKLTDSRCEGYMLKYGNESWELDALEPTIIIGLIRDHILALTDKREWQISMAREERFKAQLRDVSDRWEEIVSN